MHIVFFGLIRDTLSLLFEISKKCWTETAIT